MTSPDPQPPNAQSPRPQSFGSQAQKPPTHAAVIQQPAGWGWGRILLVTGAAVVLLPMCCCGGLIVFSATVKDFKLSHGEHLGGSPMNVRFDYEMTHDLSMFDGYYIVVQSVDGATRDRALSGSYSTRGTLQFNAFDVGPTPPRSPVRVWIEKESFRGGGRSKASNVLTIHAKKP